MIPRRGEHWQAAAIRIRDRIEERRPNILVLLILPIGLCLTLMCFFLPTLNPHLGNPSEVFSYEIAEDSVNSLWFSITPIDDEIVVTTFDRKVFRWPLIVKNHYEIQKFTDYLKKLVEIQMTSTALAMNPSPEKFSVTIAADQKLRFIHIRPILYALAEARIANYSFEVRSTMVSQDDHHQESKHL